MTSTTRGGDSGISMLSSVKLDKPPSASCDFDIDLGSPPDTAVPVLLLKGLKYFAGEKIYSSPF